MPSFACYRWLFWRTPHTLKLLNQVRPRIQSRRYRYCRQYATRNNFEGIGGSECVNVKSKKLCITVLGMSCLYMGLCRFIPCSKAFYAIIHLYLVLYFNHLHNKYVFAYFNHLKGGNIGFQRRKQMNNSIRKFLKKEKITNIF